MKDNTTIYINVDSSNLKEIYKEKALWEDILRYLRKYAQIRNAMSVGKILFHSNFLLFICS